MAEHGYTIPFQLAFPPGYPWAIRALHPLTNSYLSAGILLSVGSTGLYLFLVGRLIRKYSTKETATRAVALQFLFPAAYFLLVPYSDALFLLLTTLAFLAYENKKHISLGLFAGAATLTRSLGIVLLPTLLYGVWSDTSRTIKNKLLRSLPLASIPAAALIHYYLVYQETGNWLGLFSIHAQEGYRSLSFPVLPLLQTLHQIVTLSPSAYTIQVVYAVGLTTGAGLIVSLVGFRYLPRMYALYAFLYMILIASFTFGISNPRYVLSAFPLFWTLGALTERRPVLYLFLIAIFSGLLALEASTFARGHWAF